MKLIQKAIVKKDNTFLIVLRSPNAKFFPMHWDFPGGKLEPNEDPFLGIEREIAEETDLIVKAKAVIGVYKINLDYKGEKLPHRFTIYSTEILSGNVKLSPEHLAFKWATKEEIMRLKIEPYIKLHLEKQV